MSSAIAASDQGSPMPSDPSEGEWLTALPLRGSAPEELRAAARNADLPAFGRKLLRSLRSEHRLNKKETRSCLEQLHQLWPRRAEGNASFQPASLAYCLFQEDLSEDEISGRVETIIASRTEDHPDAETVLAAHWLIHLGAGRLDPHSLANLWRWTLESSQALLENSTAVTSTLSKLWKLEMEFLLGMTCRELKGGKKSARSAIAGLQRTLAKGTDSQGVPRADWLPELTPIIATLARIQLMADLNQLELWTNKSRKRLCGLVLSAASLLSSQRMAFSELDPAESLPVLACAARLLGDSEIKRSLPLGAGDDSWNIASVLARHAPRKLAKESVQSDDALWARLRTTWTEPLDQCLVRYDSLVPEIEAVVADSPLFAGEWRQQAAIDGKVVAALEPWRCCCWFADRDVVYLELEQKNPDALHCVRQAFLLRKESVLIVADSIRMPGAERIELQRSLPLSGEWSYEEDSVTREFALENKRVRVRGFPLSSPQDKVDGSHESTRLDGGRLILNSQASGACHFAATVFDWSDSRRRQPVEWRRLTVAEDGHTVGPDVAQAYRLRVGKKQWLLLHSMVPPEIPRTALGLHTGSETVLARLDGKGELHTLVDVDAGG